MQGGTVAWASLTGEKKLENLVEKEILMENPWKKATEEKKKNKCRALLKMREETER